MKLIKPTFYDAFSCIASACPDSCCQEWDVLVDPDQAISLGTRLDRTEITPLPPKLKTGTIWSSLPE